MEWRCRLLVVSSWRSVAGPMLLVCLTVAAPVARAEESAVPPFEMAHLYAEGRRAEAIAGLSGWSEDDLKRELSALRTIRGKLGSLESLPVRAAIMLHTDRDLFERMQAPVVETARECGIDPHAAFARALVSVLMVQSDDSREFARRWLIAMSLQSHWDLCLDDVVSWTREGLKWFPRDGELLLIQGTAREVAGSLMRVPRMDLGAPTQMHVAVTAAAWQRSELTEARAAFDASLRIDPQLHEARLRLGRVLWRLEKPEQARSPLQALLRESRDPALLYLGHLFLGRLDEDAGELPAAVLHYRSALVIDPAAQSAAVALSEALWSTGEEDEGRELLERAMSYGPRGAPRDAFMSYHLGRSGRAEEMLDALRGETLQ